MSDTLGSALARNVRDRRQRGGLSQEALAERCGLHRTYVGAIERGEVNVTLRTVEALAVAFGITPLVLLDGTPA